MTRRSLAALATTVSALGVVALPTAGPADAAAACTLTPPGRIALYQQDTELPATVSGDCQPHGYGDWFTNGLDAYAGFDSSDSTAGYVYVPDQMPQYGRQTWRPAGAGSDADCNETCDDLSQNTPYSDIRLGGYASLTGTRSGSRITFTAGSGGWSPASHSLVVRPRISGEIQTQYADGSWHRVGSAFTTGSNAKATVVLTVTARRTFRYAMYSTASYFDRASAPITR